MWRFFSCINLPVVCLENMINIYFLYAAITTISDMMPLVDENKSLVSRGLQFMNEEKYLQLELLIGENQKYNTTTLGFNIAPKINSFGRLPELVNPNI